MRNFLLNALVLGTGGILIFGTFFTVCRACWERRAPAPTITIPSVPTYEPRLKSRLDGEPFYIGDEVHLKGYPGLPWVVEDIKDNRVYVVRPSQAVKGTMSRESFPISILLREVSWDRDDPEPPKRSAQ